MVQLREVLVSIWTVVLLRMSLVVGERRTITIMGDNTHESDHRRMREGMRERRASNLFRNRVQEQFVRTLEDYEIIKPRFSLSNHIHLNKCSWRKLSTTGPEEFFMKVRMKTLSLKIKLLKNKVLLRKDYAMEDVTKDLNRLQRMNERNKTCFYSGKVINSLDSRVALSICDGLKGFINFDGRSFIIEPMREIGPHYLHLAYESSAELNSSLNPKKGRLLQCSTGSYFRDPRGITKETVEKFFEEGKRPSNNTHILKKRGNHDKYDKTFNNDNNDSGNQNRKKYDKRKNNNNGKGHDNKIDTNEIGREEEKMKLFPGATVEVFVVVDKYMVAFHGNDSLQNYVLTMMNMVADMYKDPTLGIKVEIIVAKILVLHDHPKNLKITHDGDKTLLNFCEWQFLRALSNDDEETNSAIPQYDVAVLLTRKDVCAHANTPCGTIGLAYIGGMCTTNRKCAVIEDIGLNTAYTIAHELGHNLGMTHDGIENGCKTQAGGYPHMMAAQWPTNNQVPLKWSSCSAEKITDFLSSYKSYCLHHPKSEDSSHNLELSGILPGKLYDADTQCKQQYGGVARHCKRFKSSSLSTDMCKHLWCEIEDEDECVSKLDPAAKGTKCDEGKWCMYGKCVNNTGIPESINGGWSPWVEWTRCSRSCGVGISYMERLCNNPKPENGGRYCIGDARRYRTCNTQKCRYPKPDFRTVQCSYYNNGTVSYIPVHSEHSPCSLHCRPSSVTTHYSIRFKHKVKDGTPCHSGTSDICVDGVCEKLGCDMQVNSKLEKDICGECGGDGTTCNVIEGVFTQQRGHGYVNAVDIPEGAMKVLVKEVKPCASFLALRSGGDFGSYSYDINGNWTIQLPGTYNVNGTLVYYRRRGTQELFYAEGPTKAKMHFMVLFQDYNFGVKYKYVLPKNFTATKSADPKHEGTFGWVQGLWDKCPVVCGGGIIRTGSPKCLNMNQGNVTVVANHFCKAAKRPTYQEKTCNEFKCPKVWMVSPWTACSQTCGVGRKKRSVTCNVQLPDGKWQNRSSSECAVSLKPITTQTCVMKACFLQWRTTAWSKCRGECGAIGERTRSVTCPKKNSCRRRSKPASKKKCRKNPCNFQWQVGPWNKCTKTCGLGYTSRSLVCRDERTFRVYHNSKCRGKKRPDIRKICALRPCPIKKAPGYTLQTVDLTTRTMRTVPIRPRSATGRSRGSPRMMDPSPKRMMEPRRPKKRTRPRNSRRRPTKRRTTRRRRLPLRRLPLKTVPVRRIPSKDLPVRRAPLKGLPVRQLPVKPLPVRPLPKRPLKKPTATQQRVRRPPTKKTRLSSKSKRFGLRRRLSTKLHKITNPLMVTLSVSKPEKSSECVDKMETWACYIQIKIAEAANKRFCEDDQGRRCCKTCKDRKHLSVRRKSKRPIWGPFRFPTPPRHPRTGKSSVPPKLPSS